MRAPATCPQRPPQIDEGYLSAPQSVEFPTDGGVTAFMNFYPPKNKDYALPPGQKPPLLVKIHGVAALLLSCLGTLFVGSG